MHPTTGEVYVAGFTASTDFAGTLTGAQRENAGSDDGFIARLDPTLTQLLGSTYLGGAEPDRIVAIAIHPASGEVYVAGQTVSVDFPGTAGGAQPSPAVDEDFIRRDGFVARFDPTLRTLLQATYLGGVGPEYLHALAIHPSSGEIYVAGQTRAIDFPGAAGGANAATYPFTGNIDGFISRFDPSLTRLIQSTYVGASGSDDIFGIAIHPGSGDVYVVGWTDWVDLPGTEGGAQSVMGGETDAFVARLNASLTELLQATYLGGVDNDYGYGIAVHPTRGDVYVTGETYSTDLPGTAQGAQPDRGGGDDGFVARLDPKLTRVVQTTYLGASGDDIPRAIAVQPVSGQVLVAGMTTSTDFPGAAGGSQPAYAGGDEFFGGDGFVTRFPAGLSGASSACVRRRKHPVPERAALRGSGLLARPVEGNERRRDRRVARRRNGLFLVLQRRQRRARRQGPRRPGGEWPHLGVLRSALGRRIPHHGDGHRHGHRPGPTTIRRGRSDRSPTRRPSRARPGLPWPRVPRRSSPDGRWMPGRPQSSTRCTRP